MLCPLRVGVPIPVDHPTSGGGFQFQHTIFSEILKRILSESTGELIQYVPIATHTNCRDLWPIDDSRIVDVSPSRALRLGSSLYSRVKRRLSPWAGLAPDNTLLGRQIAARIASKIDVLWNLNPLTLTTQIPFILTVWDLQHRVQPFFPEVSLGGEWQSRQDLYWHYAPKAFLSVVGTYRGSDEMQRFLGIDESRILVNSFPCPEPTSVSKDIQSEVLRGFRLRPLEYLLYPAQFWPHKNHMGLVFALNRLKELDRSFKLVLTGSDKGCMQSVLALVDKLGLSELVVNAGFVSREQLSSLYQNCFSLVYPSFFGPDNIPPLEAMSYSCPAIVADVPGSLEQYGDAVMRFNPNRPQDIADCVTRLADNRCLRDSLILKGLKLISGMTAANYVNHIEKVLIDSYISICCASMRMARSS